MCLITLRSMHRVLTEPMTVYKLLQYDQTNPRPPYHDHTGFKYTVGGLHKTELKEDSSRSIDHSSAFDQRATRLKHKFMRSHGSHNMISIGPGFHSAESVDRLIQEFAVDLQDFYGQNPKLAIYRCTIPAGAEIHWDDDGLVVSSMIIIDRVEPGHDNPNKLSLPEWGHQTYDMDKAGHFCRKGATDPWPQVAPYTMMVEFESYLASPDPDPVGTLT